MNYRICENGIYRDLTDEELAAMEAEANKTVIPKPVDLSAEVEHLKAENESLRSSITDLELALVELYESTEV